jgi:tRNA (mo5U34)-methyltransferase
MERWLTALNKLPDVTPSTMNLHDKVQIGSANDLTSAQRNQLIPNLRELHPWRKGPFNIFGVHIDTEWRSDWKWDRLKDAIPPLNGRLVLDVGCGNGYHCWRMLGADARLVVGLDPFWVYVMQYFALRTYIKEAQAFVLPLGIESLPENLRGFDTVFSMGVLYHRRSPMDHLLHLRDTLRKNGQLVLETLVIDGQLGEVLVPEGRYAQMRNVWFIPSIATLISWLRKCQFKDIQLLAVTPTTPAEQRTTDWMTFQSLTDNLAPQNPALTVEGLPAPKRAIITAVSP